jgi:hypothetical protein
MRPDQSLLNVDDLRRACVERKRPDGGSRLAHKAFNASQQTSLSVGVRPPSGARS